MNTSIGMLDFSGPLHHAPLLMEIEAKHRRSGRYVELDGIAIDGGFLDWKAMGLIAGGAA